MNIIKLDFDTEEVITLWEENMNEKWADYKDATKFIQKDKDGKIIGGFAVYYDESDGVCGNFVSGWSVRKNYQSVEAILKYLAHLLGQFYIKTEKRQVKIIGNKLGKFIKKEGEFVYYIVRGV